jgi:hypothetical protein
MYIVEDCDGLNGASEELDVGGAPALAALAGARASISSVMSSP